MSGKARFRVMLDLSARANGDRSGGRSRPSFSSAQPRNRSGAGPKHNRGQPCGRYARRSFPVISSGCSASISPRIVGAMSRSDPPSRNGRFSFDTRMNGTGKVV